MEKFRREYTGVMDKPLVDLGPFQQLVDRTGVLLWVDPLQLDMVGGVRPKGGDLLPRRALFLDQLVDAGGVRHLIVGRIEIYQIPTRWVAHGGPKVGGSLEAARQQTPQTQCEGTRRQPRLPAEGAPAWERKGIPPVGPQSPGHVQVAWTGIVDDAPHLGSDDRAPVGISEELLPQKGPAIGPRVHHNGSVGRHSVQEGLGFGPDGGCNGREAAVLGKEKAQWRAPSRHYGTIPIRVYLRQALQLRQVGTQVSQHDGNRPGLLRRSRRHQDVLGSGRHARHGHDGCVFV